MAVVVESVVPRSPVNVDHLTTDETKAKDALEVRGGSAAMEISFSMADSTNHVQGDTHQSPLRRATFSPDLKTSTCIVGRYLYHPLLSWLFA
jgi:hypothetical protein